MKRLSTARKSKKLKDGKLKSALLLLLSSFVIQSSVFSAACILSLLFDIKRGDYYIISVLSLAAGSLVGGYTVGKIKGEKGTLNSIIYCLPANLFYIATSVTLNSFKFDYNLFLTLALFIVCSAAGGTISVNTRRRQPKVRAARSKR